jgi:hypothetical protein
MRFLKNKIARNKLLAGKKTSLSLSSGGSPNFGSEMPQIVSNTKKIASHFPSPLPRKGGKEISPLTYKKVLVTKNVVKNFGRAIASFSCSKLSVPYLDEIQMTIPFDLSSFLAYVSDLRISIQSAPSFRAALLIKDNDTDEVKTNKLVFQKIAEVFIKYFSVNWIFSGKLLYKQEYLKLRNVILRKIRDPNSFISVK